MPQKISDTIRYACLRFARVVDVAEGSFSRDVVEDRLTALQSAADDALNECLMRHGHGTDDLVASAIDYLAEAHDGPWRGTAWFRNGLEILLTVTDASGPVTPGATAFLEIIQRNTSSALSQHVRARIDEPLTMDEAASAKHFEHAGAASVTIQQLLDAVERLHYGQSLEEDARVLRLAALAAPMARLQPKP